MALRIWSDLRLEGQRHPQPGPAEPALTRGIVSDGWQFLNLAQ